MLLSCLNLDSHFVIFSTVFLLHWESKEAEAWGGTIGNDMTSLLGNTQKYYHASLGINQKLYGRKV